MKVSYPVRSTDVVVVQVIRILKCYKHETPIRRCPKSEIHDMPMVILSLVIPTGKMRICWGITLKADHRELLSWRNSTSHT